jgi:hypothetical protein
MTPTNFRNGGAGTTIRFRFGEAAAGDASRTSDGRNTRRFRTPKILKENADVRGAPR